MLIVTYFNNQMKMLATHLGTWPFESLLGLEVVLASPGPSVSTKKKKKKTALRGSCHSTLEAACQPIGSATVSVGPEAQLRTLEARGLDSQSAERSSPLETFPFHALSPSEV